MKSAEFCLQMEGWKGLGLLRTRFKGLADMERSQASSYSM